MNQKTGIIAGTLFLDSTMLNKLKLKKVKTIFGESLLYQDQKTIFLQRHGKNIDVLPHNVNHKANIAALKKLGVKNIIGVGSTGSMKKGIKPGSIVIPDDFIDLNNNLSFFDDKKTKSIDNAFTIPALDNSLRLKLIKTAKKIGLKPVKNAVYFNSRGPRLETKAEIKLFSKFADIVGMTIAKEAVLANEVGIKYCALCTVENYANGISKNFSVEEMAKNREQTSKKVMMIIEKING